jgi:hypothetical protein
MSGTRSSAACGTVNSTASASNELVIRTQPRGSPLPGARAVAFAVPSRRWRPTPPGTAPPPLAPHPFAAQRHPPLAPPPPPENPARAMIVETFFLVEEKRAIRTLFFQDLPVTRDNVLDVVIWGEAALKPGGTDSGRPGVRSGCPLLRVDGLRNRAADRCLALKFAAGFLWQPVLDPDPLAPVTNLAAEAKLGWVLELPCGQRK